MKPVRGLIFDLDGTLVDSALDFDEMRREMHLPPGVPILEAIAELAPDDQRRCQAILDRHEEGGAARAQVVPGVKQFLDAAAARRWRLGLITRNCRRSAQAALERFTLCFDPVICREDGPVKPDPAAVWEICRLWDVTPAEVAVIGDYRFDLEAGRRAGARTVLVARGRDVRSLDWASQADFVLDSFDSPGPVLAWLDGKSA